MKLQQLRYIWEVAHHDLNVSATAQSLYTSQPGISKQIRLLEDELEVEIFCRSGKHLTQITPAGEKILQVAGEILQKVESIKQLAQEHNNPDTGHLTIAATQTLARYGLPEALGQFRNQFPKIQISLEQGTPEQVAQLLLDGQADFAFASAGLGAYSDIISLPCCQWGLSLLVPRGHELADDGAVTLERLAEFPLITYAPGLAGHIRVEEAFAKRGLIPNRSCNAADADIIKTYVRMELGVGVVGSMAYDNQLDNDLVAIDASHLFEPCVATIGIWKGAYLRSFSYQFIEQLAPHLTKDLVDQALTTHNREERCKLFNGLQLPQL